MTTLQKEQLRSLVSEGLQIDDYANKVLVMKERLRVKRPTKSVLEIDEHFIQAQIPPSQEMTAILKATSKLQGRYNRK